MGEKQKSKVPAVDIARITELLKQDVPDEYAGVRNWRDELHAAVLNVIIKRVEPAFNRTLASASQDTLEEKQDLTRWANAELREMGLAVRCPKTGQPAILHADPGNYPKTGRFQIELTGRENGRRRTVSSPSALEVELCSAPSQNPLAEYWSRKLDGNKGKNRGR